MGTTNDVTPLAYADPTRYAALWAEGTEVRTPTKQLGQQDFLRLLVAQMTQQDPLSPSSDLDSIGQMANFTSLEQTRTMIEDLSQLRLDQEILKANALIGRTVAVRAGVAGEPDLFGRVTAVQIEAGRPKVVVDGQRYDLGQVRMITVPAAPTTDPAMAAA